MNGKAKDSKRDTDKPQQRSNRRRNRGTDTIAEWGDANAQKVLEAISAIARNGFAVRFGYTRDGGAFAIGVVGDGDPYTEYVRPNEDIDLYLDGLIQDYRDGSRPTTTSQLP
jgi:hypothetical protein